MSLLPSPPSPPFQGLLVIGGRRSRNDVKIFASTHKQQPIQQHDNFTDLSSSYNNNIVPLPPPLPPPPIQYQLSQQQQHRFLLQSSSSSFAVFPYMMVLLSLLVVWVWYLLLPRGFRKQYCSANRKRYARRIDPHMPPAGYWLPVHSQHHHHQQQQSKSTTKRTTTTRTKAGVPISIINDTTTTTTTTRRNNSKFTFTPTVPTPLSTTTGDLTMTTTMSSPVTIPRGNTTTYPSHGPPPHQQHQQQQLVLPLSSSSSQRRRRRRSVSTPPTPEHPALKIIPPNKVIAETMARLQGQRGIRLVAHGVHCDPKRVWIRLHDDTITDDTITTPAATTNNVQVEEQPCLTWQTEFPRRIPNNLSNNHLQQQQQQDATSSSYSIVLMRGSLHKIVLKQILYIDVGKKTQALQLTPTSVPDTTCWSLLTQNGSLDLQASTPLERDALVSCFSMILDDVHEEDWRALYEASPEPSLTQFSTTIRPS
jgi:hypothetical protein